MMVWKKKQLRATPVRTVRWRGEYPEGGQVRSWNRIACWGRCAQRISALLIWVGVSLVPVVASATVVEELSVEELAHEAVYVVRAQVGVQYVHPERGERGEIYTRTELTVLDYLKGDGPRHITVQQLGGDFGSYRMHVSGNAELRPGDEVIVFLDYDEHSALSFVVGLAQGLFRVTRTPASVWVERELHGLSFYSAGAAPYELPVFVQALSDLESRVRAPFVLETRDMREEVRP